MAHTHREKTYATRGWTSCVTPERCAANPERQSAHGNIVTVSTCSCGATRESENNGQRINYGPWVDADA